MTSYASIDQSAFPLVIVTFSDSKASEENFQTYLNGMLSVYQRKEPFIIVFDASQAIFLHVKYQRQQAQWMANNHQTIETYCLGTAYVIPNDIIRTALKAIFAFQEQGVPYEIFATLEGGIAWAKSRAVSV